MPAVFSAPTTDRGSTADNQLSVQTAKGDQQERPAGRMLHVQASRVGFVGTQAEANPKPSRPGQADSSGVQHMAEGNHDVPSKPSAGNT